MTRKRTNSYSQEVEMPVRADWIMLRRQKLQLLNTITRLEDEDKKLARQLKPKMGQPGRRLSEKEKIEVRKYKRKIRLELNALNGLLHFLDHIQDNAVEAGVPGHMVFAHRKPGDEE